MSLVVILSLGGALTSGCAISQPSPPAGEQLVSTVTVSQAQRDERLPIADEAGVDESGIDTSGLPFVRWGGTIVGVSNLADGRTMLEIVSRPLYSGGRPIHDDRSDGRFMAELDQFLDPEIVKPGRDMTVVGHLNRRTRGQIGQSSYVFPVVSVQDYRYWKKRVPTPPRHFPHWNTYPPHAFSDPFWYDWPFPPYPPRHLPHRQ
ncbi:MAG: hypothetical protein HKN42_00685 [Granulosicoccus sp.]|nr:hypothetical protein [Granulosicoccus sp.]